MRHYKLYKNASGVIMMETLLSLPVYMLLLACLFWLGELCLVKLALTSGENLRLWENGIRYPITFVAEEDIFYFSPSISDAEVVTGRGGFNFIPADASSLDWGTRTSGRAQINTKRSSWSWGINNFISNFTNSGNNYIAPGAEEQLMISRGTIDNPLNGYVLSRAAYARRDGIYERGTDSGSAWKTEYLSTWNLGVAGTISPVAQGDYARVDRYGSRVADYVTWSE